MKKVIMIIMLILIITFATGCQKSAPIVQTKYVCADGKEVSDSSLCKTTNSADTSAPSQNNVVPAQNNAPKTMSTSELTSLVQSTIRKYIPEASSKPFIYGETYPRTKCGENWYYPSKETTSDIVVTAQINVCDVNDAYDNAYTITELSRSPITTVKHLSNGDVMLDERKNEFTANSGRYDYGMSFPCQNKFNIAIYTWDFYGDSLPSPNSGDTAFQVFNTYDIDKSTFDKMVNEILGYCK
ncbi:MAG: hypothetical protein WC758_05125 [Candidatus Woesearchaeota archaeon]